MQWLSTARRGAGVPLYAHLVQQLMRAAAYPADGADLDDEDEFIRFREQVRTPAQTGTPSHARPHARPHAPQVKKCAHAAGSVRARLALRATERTVSLPAAVGAVYRVYRLPCGADGGRSARQLLRVRQCAKARLIACRERARRSPPIRRPAEAWSCRATVVCACALRAALFPSHRQSNRLTARLAARKCRPLRRNPCAAARFAGRAHVLVCACACVCVWVNGCRSGCVRLYQCLCVMAG